MAAIPIASRGPTVGSQVPAGRPWQANSIPSYVASISSQANTHGRVIRHKSGVRVNPSAVRNHNSRAARRHIAVAAGPAGDEDPVAEGYISDYPVTDDEVPDDVIASLAAAQKPSAAPQSPAPVDPVTDSLDVEPADVIAAEEVTAAFVPATDTVTGGAAYDPEEDIALERRSLKRILIDSLYGTDRGLRASGETRAEVAELVVQLEALNPTPATTYSPLLSGDWVLA